MTERSEGMPTASSGDRFDIVLVGPTGVVGRDTAAHLARHAPAGCRWAMAGRNRAKLEAVREGLTAINPACADLPLLHADAGDRASLDEVARSARVVATTVGPYLRVGEPMVAACAEAGTHYLDATGEPEFIDDVYVRHHDTAMRTGARIVHACAFDSIPQDLGAYFTVQQLPEGVPLRVQSFLSIDPLISGGSLHSALAQASRLPQWNRAARARARIEPQPPGRRIRTAIGPSRHDGRWALPLGWLDTAIVTRSARGLDRYGPDFSYSSSIAIADLPTAAGIVVGAGGALTMAQIPPVRRWMERRIPAGEGPSDARRASGWFRVDFVGEGGGRRVATEAFGRDIYDETSMMLAESTLCMAFDDVPKVAGQLTTAEAMGNHLIDRINHAGFTIRVRTDDPPGDGIPIAPRGGISYRAVLAARARR
jgi:short subunit dehydrogenase-like uncharacterized protein